MTNDTRSPEEIERDIERERAGLTDTLSDLQDRFSVETIARQVTDQVREHGGDIGRSVSDAVKRNPLALALTGAGLAWLMLSDRSGPRDHGSHDPRYGRFEHDDRYDRRLGMRDRGRGFAEDHATDVFAADRAYRARAATGHGYYGRAENTPSWARDDDDDRPGIASRAGSAVSDAGDSVSAAASSTAETVRSAGSSAAKTASGAAGSVADTAKGAAGSVTDTARSAGGAVADAGRSVSDSARSAASTAADRAAALRDRLAEGTENLSEEARSRVIAARRKAIEARDAAYDYARQGRDRAVDIFEEQPLVAGALALAVGAAIAAALPRSRTEDQYLGEQSDRLMEEAERIYAEEKAKLGKVAEAAGEEAKKVAREVRDEADSAAKSAVEKAKESGERIAGAAESEAKKQNVGDVKKSS